MQPATRQASSSWHGIHPPGDGLERTLQSNLQTNAIYGVTMNEFETWFANLAGGNRPHPWQRALGEDAKLRDRLIRIPTGFGKTAGTVLAWLWNRVKQNDDRWPRRLAFCLPMRVLVEQTESEVRKWLKEAGVLWDGTSDHAGKVGVHVLMGGADSGEWHLHPEQPAILIGTQDMLLSRALNRGYASPRARWPMEFGLLNHDCLWVLDEVQLMDVGLATSAQLQQFRHEDAARGFRPCASWWMSATLQPEWLRSVDTTTLIDGMGEPDHIPAATREGPLWEVTKSVSISPCADESALADLTITGHRALVDGLYGRITLVIVNTVDRAVAVHGVLAKRRDPSTDLRLIHSRFRGAERAAWRKDFLAREHCIAGVDRIILATQVVEAGVDVSAGCLVTDLAPWPSLVQRFGRAARYGGSATIIVAERPLDDDKAALPYERNALVAARDLGLNTLHDVAQRSLEDFEAGLSAEARAILYPYAPDHLLLRQEYDELFDTTPDLAGADLDISRFIRSGDERDCQVFWTTWTGEYPDATVQPARLALCPVPFLKAREWLCNKESLREGCRAYIQDYLDGGWRLAKRRDLIPGRVVLVDAAWGGYALKVGFTGVKAGKKDETVPPIPLANPAVDALADAAQDREDLSAATYQTIATHGALVGRRAQDLARELKLPDPLMKLLNAAGRWHDVGKVHPAFRGSIRAPGMPTRPDLAKAPKDAWLPLNQLYDAGPGLGRRGGFRHELASALAALELLAACRPEHVGVHESWSVALPNDVVTASPTIAADHPLVIELAAYDADTFDLFLYLIVAHHGKVRVALHASPADQKFALAERLGYPIRGICAGDVLPAFPLMTEDGSAAILPALTLSLDPAQIGLSPRFGRSWRERTLALQRKFGPAALAWLETLVRTADVRASSLDLGDPLLENRS